MSLTLRAIEDIPLINEGDDISQIIIQSLDNMQLKLQNNDVIVLAQKIVSKSEGRLIDLREVEPSAEAMALGEETEKDPRLVEMILQESSVLMQG
jgi:coenzyme F420-0:L-glutamate ligase/coenzyme F420-1:gamma-L-glutamate ligase